VERIEEVWKMFEEGRWHALLREKRSNAAHGQETQKAQPEREIVKGKFEELSKC